MESLKDFFSHSVLIKLARAQAAQPGIHFFRKISRSACGSSFKDALLRRKKKKPSCHAPKRKVTVISYTPIPKTWGVA